MTRPAISVDGITPVEQLFHNERLNVYPTRLKFADIEFWQDNLRTMLAFDVLKSATSESLDELSLEKVTAFLAHDRPELKLGDLARSISANGVRVPLIVLDDRTLLDGNRRFFACSFLFHERPSPAHTAILERIPAHVIKRMDIDEQKRQKILAEANFVSDYKVPWPLNVKAKVIAEYFAACVERGLSESAAHGEIEDVYGVKHGNVREYVDAVSLSDDFIEEADDDGERRRRREIVQRRFVYFWEYRNKSTRGRTALTDRQRPGGRTLFFHMMASDCFTNMKEVEPFVRSCKSQDYTWQMLKLSKGAKIKQVVAIINEQKAVRSAEDKVRNFQKWLTQKAAPTTFNNATFRRLRHLADLCLSILEQHKPDHE